MQKSVDSRGVVVIEAVMVQMKILELFIWEGI